MTRKDYVKIAAILRSAGIAETDDQPFSLMAAFGDMLAEDNPRFDRARFEQACQL